MLMSAETGFPRADVADESLRVRRRQVLARLVQRLILAHEWSDEIAERLRGKVR